MYWLLEVVVQIFPNGGLWAIPRYGLNGQFEQIKYYCTNLGDM